MAAEFTFKPLSTAQSLAQANNGLTAGRVWPLSLKANHI